MLLGVQTVRLRAAGVAADGVAAVVAVADKAADARVAALSAARGEGGVGATADGTLAAAAGVAATPAPGRDLGDEWRGMPACAMRGERAANFLMVFMGHSGSTAMMTALKPHSQVHITGYEPVDHYERATDTAAALAYAHAFFTDAAALNRTGGFKIRPYHIRRAPDEWRQLVRRHGVRVIWQYRQNVLKQAVGTYTIDILGDRTAYEGLVVASPTPAASPPLSVRSAVDDTASADAASAANTTGESAAQAVGDLAAADAGAAADVQPSPTPRVTRFHAEPRVLYDIMRNRVLGDQEVAEAVRLLGADDCVLPVSYEEFLADPAATMRRLSAFLGIDPAEAHPSRRAKATADALCEVLINWGEVCAAFYPCPELRPLLDDAVCRCASALTASAFVPARSSPYCLVKQPRLLGERARDRTSMYRRSK